MIKKGSALGTARVNEKRGIADDILSSSLRTATEQELSSNRTPGAQVAVRRDGKLLWSACFGRLRLPARGGDEDEEVEDIQYVRYGDRFVIASITKLVVACVAMFLVERGDLNLDDTIDQWLPELPNADRITLRMLLSHGSGLREYFNDDFVRKQFKDDPFRTWSRREIMDAIVRLGPEAEPGERFAYRNTNYLVMGEILELSTRKSVESLVQDYISRPLGVGAFSFAEDPPGAGRLATPYNWLPLRRHNPYDSLEYTGGSMPSDAWGEVWTDGGIAASAEDLAVFTEALFNGCLLRPQTVEEMSTPPGYSETFINRVLQSALTRTSKGAYGLGVAIEQQGNSRHSRQRNSRLLGHDGMYLGWNSATTYDTRSRVAVTVLTNLAGMTVPAQRLEKKLRAALA